jgi:hypothetical protein
MILDVASVSFMRVVIRFVLFLPSVLDDDAGRDRGLFLVYPIGGLGGTRLPISCLTCRYPRQTLVPTETPKSSFLFNSNLSSVYSHSNISSILSTRALFPGRAAIQRLVFWPCIPPHAVGWPRVWLEGATAGEDEYITRQTKKGANQRRKEKERRKHRAPRGCIGTQLNRASHAGWADEKVMPYYYAGRSPVREGLTPRDSGILRFSDSQSSMT